MQQVNTPTLAESARRCFAGTVLARPWFDHAVLAGLRSLFFPSSRLWAAARTAGGDVQRFYDAVPLTPRLEQRDRLQRTLARFEQRRAASNAIEAEWQAVFFGASAQSRAEPEAYRAAVEAARRDLSHAYNASRRDFGFLIGRHVPRVRLTVETPEAVDALYGRATQDLAPFVAPPATLPEIEVSQSLRSAGGRDFWLRFASPSARLGDTVYARVHEPDGVTDPPTVIFGHGICVEFDHWNGLIDESTALVGLGYRVIRPEAPWHGRRLAPGRFGGEAVIGTFPTGTLDAFTGALQEWAVLAHWARATSRGPLVFAGSSMGAMTSQLAADRARDWPAAMRPDAMLLITHTGDLSDAVINGALSTLWARPAEVKARGWTEDMARVYFSLMNPVRPPVMAPDRIVSVLGRRDVILPFAGGQRLVERWGLPAENVFIWDRGHFSVPLTMIRNDGPLQRLRQIVAAL